MSPAEGSRDLLAVDRGREDAPEVALDFYAAAEPQLVAASVERIEWIFGRPRGSLSPALLPLMEWLSVHSIGLIQRRALHQRAGWHMTRAETDAARALWSAALALGRADRDELWVGCLLNLSLVVNSMGRSCEGLVLAGAASRVAEERGEHYSCAFASLRRANILIQLGDLDAAQGELRRVDLFVERIASGSRREAIESSNALAWARLLRATGDYPAALAAQKRHIKSMEASGPTKLALLVGSHCSRLRIEYELDESRGAELLAELEAIPERFALDEGRDGGWKLELLRFRLMHALRSGVVPGAEALRHARALIDFLPQAAQDSHLMSQASELGRIFAEDLNAPDDSRRAYDLAATAALRCIVQISKGLEEFQELKEATPQDLRILQESRRRMEVRHAELFRAMTALWDAGHPAAELVLDEKDMVRACAWCKRVFAGGEWIPVLQFLPPSLDFQMSHGICSDCRCSL